MKPTKRLEAAIKQMRNQSAAANVLETYVNLHEEKLFAHWIWIALSRIAAGEPEVDVMYDYGYLRAGNQEVGKT